MKLRLMICLFSLFVSLAFAQTTTEGERYTQALASLLSNVHDLEAGSVSIEDQILFSDDDMTHLWNKAELYLQSMGSVHRLSKLTQAQASYERYKQVEGAPKESLALCINDLTTLWEEAIESEQEIQPAINLLEVTARSKESNDPNLEKNPFLPKKAKKKMRPYLVPHRHPMRSFLDSVCLKKRITVDKETFEAEGFHVFSTRPRSYISVARHPEMQGYLVKVYFDTVLKNKRGQESWEWLVLRCEGAEKVRDVIEKKRIKHFAVAKKWIYCLPAHPSPPRDFQHKRHFAMLLVTDMDLAPDSVNYHAWKNYITEEHLDELYLIISRAKGSSYRPDNISYSNKGNFAFIDTEYPSNGPDFKSIRSHLNSDMRRYWDHLIRNGGP